MYKRTVLVTALIALAGILGSASASAASVASVTSAAPTSVYGGPFTGLDATNATINIALTNFPTSGGLFLMECNAPVGSARPTACNAAAQLWISNAQGASFTSKSDIIFKPTAKYTTSTASVDCTKDSCGIFLRYDHTPLFAADYSQDQFIPLTFKATPTTTVALASDSITATFGATVLSTNVPINIAYRAPATFRASANSGIAVEITSITPNCSYVNAIVTALKGAGHCAIRVTTLGDTTYAAQSVSFPMVLTPGTQFIIAKAIPTSLKVRNPIALPLETNFGGVVKYKATSKSCAVELNMLQANKQGLCIVVATSPAKAGMWSALNVKIIFTAK